MSVFKFRNYGGHGTLETRQRMPIDVEAAKKYGAHVLPDYCSKPIPALKSQLLPDGYNSFDIESKDIGLRSAVSMTFASIYRNCPLALDLDNAPLFQSDMRIASPSRKLISHLLIHRPSFGDVNPRLMVFRQTPGDLSAAVAHSAQQLRPLAEICKLGRGLSKISIPEVEDHHVMVGRIFEQLGWDPNEFEAIRVVMDYPVLHSVVRLQFRLDLK